MRSSTADGSCWTTIPPRSRLPAPDSSPGSGSSFPPRARRAGAPADPASIGLSDAPTSRVRSGRRSPHDVEKLPDDLRETLAEQAKLRGEPLYPYLFYARNPAYFRAAKAMFAALQEETKRVPVTLRPLLNRRVAAWNGCEF